MVTAVVARHPSPSSYIGQLPTQVVDRPISSVAMLQLLASITRSRDLVRPTFLFMNSRPHYHRAQAAKTWTHYANNLPRCLEFPSSTNSLCFETPRLFFSSPSSTRCEVHQPALSTPFTPLSHDDDSTKIVSSARSNMRLLVAKSRDDDGAEIASSAGSNMRLLEQSLTTITPTRASHLCLGDNISPLCHHIRV